MELGVVVSPHGITGKKDAARAAHSLAYGASAASLHLLVLTTADLLALADDKALIKLLRELYLQALASGGVGCT